MINLLLIIKSAGTTGHVATVLTELRENITRRITGVNKKNGQIVGVGAGVVRRVEEVEVVVEVVVGEMGGVE